MKTLDELYNEVVASNELKNEFVDASNGGREKVESFLRDHDCYASLEELKTFLEEKSNSKKMSLDEMESVAGGKVEWYTPVISVTTFAGCYAEWMVSLRTSPKADQEWFPDECF